MIGDELIKNLLLEKKLISGKQLDAAVGEQLKNGEPLVRILVNKGYVREDELLFVLSDYLKIPHIKIDVKKIDPLVVKEVPARVAMHYNFMPLWRENGVLTVAVCNPPSLHLLDELELMLKTQVRFVLSNEKEVVEALRKCYGTGAETIEQLLREGNFEVDVVGIEAKTGDLRDEALDASVIKFVNQILVEAIQERATDVHVEPFEDELRIRYRIDGFLYKVPTPPAIKHFQSAVVARIKIMADLNIAEKRLPQDGRIMIKVAGEEFDLRVSILPTPHGETVDLRILSRGSLFYSLEQLGLSGKNVEDLNALIKKPHGIIMVTGPTGSGKTTTMYACLNKINSLDRKIITIEDPIEYQMKGITQMQVQPKIGFTFATGLRSILRHDPNIIMVGEVRDAETAEITIRTALTGHLVFSSLHTNDAAGGVSRLLDIGIEPYLVSSSVLALVAQRLVRRICPDCRAEKRPDPLTLRQLGIEIEEKVKFYQGEGCPKCKFTGYHGRTGIYEILLFREEIHNLVMKRAPASVIKQKGLSLGMKTLRHDGWEKIKEGITTVDEVLRVTAEDAFSEESKSVPE